MADITEVGPLFEYSIDINGAKDLIVEYLTDVNGKADWIFD